ncbi:hypothetical protein K432DRAFT_376825 [Lepidopterella palustris CBS 459.81]|uniref:LITAF domain-containing protein n=1 Tax=Lepidopterella palustris CBS 459.81 TaxID=1314670 RepID=A0A8E2ELT7_9PEZI|nr:hypothetical protein K432DRAFT_376825 [Lepidopterella palustris CBS 459.81]
MNQYPPAQPMSPDVTGQPPIYQDPNQPQMHQQQPMYQQQPPQPQMAYAPPTQQPQGAYIAPQQPIQQQYQQPIQHQQNPGMPLQQPSGTVYQNATPVASLGRGPAPVDCPACGQRAMTNVAFETGNTTHGWAAVLCLFACLGCIPYLMNSLKDVQHKCGRCGVLLATWHRSGTTEVHLHN